MSANLYALGAIALWATLASLGVALQHVPPFLLTGIALLIGYPTKALTNPVFYLKLGLIAIGLAILRAIFRRTGSGHAAMGITKVLAAALLIAWIATIMAGRLLAYTYTWLSVDSVRR